MIGNNFHETSADDLTIIFNNPCALEPVIDGLQKVIEIGFRMAFEDE